MTDDYVPVRVTAAQFRYDREQYTEGDELDVPQRIAARHPRTLTVIDDGEPNSNPDASETDVEVNTDDVDPHPDDVTVDELRDRISDVDDLSLLRGIRELEEESDARDTALEAIDARIRELEE